MIDQVEQIKQKIDIVEVIGDRVDLKKSGRNFKGLCPFHGEKTPSFMVSPERQSYKCFGCGKGGDVFTFLQDYEGMSFLEALESSASQVGIKIEKYKPTAKDERRKRLVEIVHMAGEYYQWILDNHKSADEAREYLKSRKIGTDARKHFSLGYAPSSWRQVSEFLVKKKGYSVEVLEAVGLVIKSEKGYYDRFRGRVMFPLKDHKGMIVGFSGRTLSSDEKEAKYINSPETDLYHKSQMLYGLYENREFIRKKDRIVVVEGELDLIPSWQAGVKEVVAIKGSAFTQEQARLILRYTKNVIMALDADSAGNEAVKRAVNVAEGMDMSIRVVQIEGGKDPGDVASENSKVWREMVEKSVSYYDFYIDVAVKNHGRGNARAISEDVVPVLANIENSVVQAHYAKKLAEILSVPERSVYEEIDRVKKKKDLSVLKKKVKKIEDKKISRKDQMEKYLLSIILQKFTQVSSEIEKIELEWIGLGSVRRIIEAIKGLGERKLEIGKFGKKLAPELQEVLDECYLRNLEGLDDKERTVKEVRKLIQDISSSYLRSSLNELSGQIEKAEGEGDQKSVARLEKEFASLTKKMNALR